MTVLASTLFSIGALIGTLVLLGVVLLWRNRERAQGRRNPLTRDLLRSPGQSIRNQLDDLRWDVAMYLSLGMLPIPLAGGIVLANWVELGKRPSGMVIGVVFIAALGAIIWIAWKLWNSLRRIQKLRLGHDAELAVGQQLNELMQHGFRVFHDFPAEKRRFNIDHVVVGPSGVFAVETKGRSKPSRREAGGSSWEVDYDGKILRFPGWSETAPIEQAEAAAHWLKKWLARAATKPVDVRPVLILPGWYINRSSSNGIPVLAGGQITGYFTKARSVLDAQDIEGIADQIETRCRDVAPTAFRADEEEN